MSRYPSGHGQGWLAATLHMDGVCCCTEAALDILRMDNPKEQDRMLREIAANPTELRWLREALAKDKPAFARLLEPAP